MLRGEAVIRQAEGMYKGSLMFYPQRELKLGGLGG
jgi:hypothetical protein